MSNSDQTYPQGYGMYFYVAKWSDYQHKQTVKWVKLHRSLITQSNYVCATENQKLSMLTALVICDQDGKFPNNQDWLNAVSGANPFDVDFLLSINYITADQPDLSTDGDDTLLFYSNTNNRKELKETEAFNRFWTAYPKKSGRKDSIKAWHQVNGDDHIEPILAALSKLSGRWSELKERRESHFIPHPATWLRGERWNDEVEGGPKTDLERFDDLNRGAI